MDETLEFLVMVDDADGLPEAILRHFPEAVRRKENSCDLRGNWIEVWPNDDADRDLVGGDEGYLYYAWEVQATPVVDVDEDHQVRLARELVSCFRALGGTAVVAANFEDRV